MEKEVNIDTKGMKVAQLNNEQLQQLNSLQQKINENASQEIYILAVTRH